MRLEIGAFAPSFETLSTHGVEVSLEKLKGKKVLLSFYRYASCPLCNLRVQELLSYKDQLEEQGLVMVAVFQSTAERINEYVEKSDVPIIIIPDPELRLYKRYGLENSWLGMIKAMLKPSKFIKAKALGFSPGPTDGPVNRLPGDFIIDENGKLLQCYYGADIGDHLSIDKILAYLKKE